MVYLPTVLTNVTTVNMWGGYVTITGEHMGPVGTTFDFEFGLSNTTAAAGFVTYTVNSTTSIVTVVDTTAVSPQ